MFDVSQNVKNTNGDIQGSVGGREIYSCCSKMTTFKPDVLLPRSFIAPLHMYNNFRWK